MIKNEKWKMKNVRKKWNNLKKFVEDINTEIKSLKLFWKNYKWLVIIIIIHRMVWKIPTYSVWRLEELGPGFLELDHRNLDSLIPDSYTDQQKINNLFENDVRVYDVRADDDISCQYYNYSELSIVPYFLLFFFFYRANLKPMM